MQPPCDAARERKRGMLDLDEAFSFPLRESFRCRSVLLWRHVPKSLEPGRCIRTRATMLTSSLMAEIHAVDPASPSPTISCPRAHHWLHKPRRQRQPVLRARPFHIGTAISTLLLLGVETSMMRLVSCPRPRPAVFIYPPFSPLDVMSCSSTPLQSFPPLCFLRAREHIRLSGRLVLPVDLSRLSIAPTSVAPLNIRHCTAPPSFVKSHAPRILSRCLQVGSGSSLLGLSHRRSCLDRTSGQTDSNAGQYVRQSVQWE